MASACCSGSKGRCTTRWAGCSTTRRTIKRSCSSHEFCDAAFGKAAAPMLAVLRPALSRHRAVLGVPRHPQPGVDVPDIYGQRRKSSRPVPAPWFPLHAELARVAWSATGRRPKGRPTPRRCKIAAGAGPPRVRLREGRWSAVVHLYHAFQIQPDRLARPVARRDRRAQRARSPRTYDARGRTKPRRRLGVPHVSAAGARREAPAAERTTAIRSRSRTRRSTGTRRRCGRPPCPARRNWR